MDISLWLFLYPSYNPDTMHQIHVKMLLKSRLNLLPFEFYHDTYDQFEIFFCFINTKL
jgi:hypothetical protein